MKRGWMVGAVALLGAAGCGTVLGYDGEGYTGQSGGEGGGAGAGASTDGGGGSGGKSGGGGSGGAGGDASTDGNAGSGGVSGGGGGGGAGGTGGVDASTDGNAGNAGSGGVSGGGGSGGAGGTGGTAGGAGTDAGQDPCAGVACTSPPTNICDDTTTLRTYTTPGACSGGTCSYPSSTTTCPNGCANGACKSDPCAGVTCTSPSANTCLDANTLRTFASPGACSGGTCSYPSSTTTCPNGCANGACQNGGTCTLTTVPATSWANWPIPNPPSSGLPNPMSYTVSASGLTVKDNVTGLTWQRNVDANSYTWADAKAYCANLTLDGCTGWRLPSRIELVSLVDWTRVGPAIDPTVFPGTPSVWSWSSSPLKGSSSEAWMVNFANGATSSNGAVTSAYRVRCVR